jgi:hypothetical protein
MQSVTAPLPEDNDGIINNALLRQEVIKILVLCAAAAPYQRANPCKSQRAVQNFQQRSAETSSVASKTIPFWLHSMMDIRCRSRQVVEPRLVANEGGRDGSHRRRPIFVVGSEISYMCRSTVPEI